MAKKRRLKVGKLIAIIILLGLIIVLLVFGFRYLKKKEKDANYYFDKSELQINEIDYSDIKQFDLDLHSKSYMLVRLNDLKVLYGKNIYDRFYPASLTKIVTLDTVINNFNNLDDTSNFTYDDYNEIISANASIAGLDVNKEYSLRDLLYALVLPSGADASKALENYFNVRGMNLVEEMNKYTNKRGLRDSHFTNCTGLHDENLYTSLDDYFKIVLNTLLNKNGKEILKSFEKEIADGKIMKSTLISLANRDDDVCVYGGKTGFTGEAGENIMTLFSKDNRSYLLILANAQGNPYLNQPYHIDDVNMILANFVD